jgi:hypothetical protein
MSHVVLPGPLREGINPDLNANVELRDRSPENLQRFVAESLTAEQKKPRIDTIHSWNPGQSSLANSDANGVQLSNHQVTQGQSTGEILRLSESATGADAASWGSTPPALYSTTEETLKPAEEPARRRFKLAP